MESNADNLPVVAYGTLRATGRKHTTWRTKKRLEKTALTYACALNKIRAGPGKKKNEMWGGAFRGGCG